MIKEIGLMEKYSKTKPIYECMTGKEVKQFALNLKKEIDKTRREMKRWQEKKMDAKGLREEKRHEFEVNWRKDRVEQLTAIFKNVESQISGWFND